MYPPSGRKKHHSMKNLLFTLGLCAIMGFGCQPAPDIEADKAAIRALIDQETEAYFAQDFETWKGTHLESPSFRKHAYWEGFPQKIVFHNGFESLQDEKKKQFEADATLWQGFVGERSNENFRIGPDMAWYTFEQISHDKGTGQFLGRSLEARFLEKHDDQWKIAYLSYLYFPSAGTEASDAEQ